jgi:hypothetical protein
VLLTDQGPPHLVDSDGARTCAVGVTGGVGAAEGILEARSEAQHDESSAKLAKALHGKDGTHHSASPFGGSKLGGNDARKRVVTADACWG